MSSVIEELNGSELGTKEYWEKSYTTEIKNYKANGDPGEIWFDEDSQLRVIRWVLKNNVPLDSTIVDIGCGNGMMLIEFARENFTQLTGVDYSEKAIQLSENIAKDQELNIKYKVADILADNFSTELGTYHIVHDKGTYDAISLNPESPKEKRLKYIDNVSKILDDDGLFIITSCNWTECELIESFQNTFEKSGYIPAPTFRFGGSVGTVVTSLVFKKCLK